MRGILAMFLAAGLMGTSAVAIAEEAKPADPITEVVNVVDTIVAMPLKLIEDLTK